MSSLDFRVTVSGDLDAMMQSEIRAAARAVKSGVGGATRALKDDWRAQVRSGGLPNSLVNSIRGEVYPKGRDSANAGGLVYTKAPKLTGVFDQGAVITAKNARWLAIPTKWAGRRGPGVRFPAPAEWSKRTGIRLRFVSLGNGMAALVAENAWGETDRKGTLKAMKAKGRGKKAAYRREHLMIYILVPQVRLSKRMDLMAAAERIAATVPGRIVSAWRS